MKLFTTALHTHQIVSRPFQGEADFWRVRQLLIETYPITPTSFNWEIRRWDGWRYHRQHTDITPLWHERIHLWETETGRLVGVAHPESSGDACFELHPDYRCIENDMIAWAEDHLSAPTNENPACQLLIAALDYDSPRRRLLEQRGYERLPYTFMERRLRFGSKPLHQPILETGYFLRSARPKDEDDYQRTADILNAAFNRTMHTAQECRNFATQSPSYHDDLELVAEAQDESFAALVGVTYDEVNRRGIFEPVCTHPDHRRKGLARALMFEGMCRLKALGATDLYVNTGDDVAANALYEDVGFTEAYEGHIWRKVLA